MEKPGFRPHWRQIGEQLTVPDNPPLRLRAVKNRQQILAFQESDRMRSLTPIFAVLRAAALVVLVVAVAACARNGAGGVGVGNTPGGGAPGSQQEFLVSVGDRVFFETDSSNLTPTAMATLDKQAAWLNKYNQYRIMLEGHADERGTREYNIALGARRAAVVVNYLVSRGVNQGRITSKSFGKERPVAICNDISCWSQNRRAVTVVQ
jgi:peptidoglycan-associated lipoprotein